jgi:hypothetical protein
MNTNEALHVEYTGGDYHLIECAIPVDWPEVKRNADSIKYRAKIEHFGKYRHVYEVVRGKEKLIYMVSNWKVDEEFREDEDD